MPLVPNNPKIQIIIHYYTLLDYLPSRLALTLVNFVHLADTDADTATLVLSNLYCSYYHFWRPHWQFHSRIPEAEALWEPSVLFPPLSILPNNSASRLILHLSHNQPPSSTPTCSQVVEDEIQILP